MISVPIIDFLVVVFYSLWLFSTIYHNIPERYFPYVKRKLAKVDMIRRFLPGWHFFAPNPGIHSYHLLYRDQLSETQIGNWKEVRINATGSPRPLWNPSKTFNKAILDIAMELIEIINTSRNNSYIIKISIPYLTVLTHVSNIPRTIKPIATQFLIMRSSPETGYEIILLSDLHSL